MFYSFASVEAILATVSFYDSKRSIGFVRFFVFPVFFFVLLTARSVLVHASEVPAEAFCSCPSNKAEQQFKEKHLKLKTISSERELKKSNEMNKL